MKEHLSAARQPGKREGLPRVVLRTANVLSPSDVSRRNAGFTLLEMLIVLAVLGLALSLVLLRGPPVSAGFAARATARDLAGTLRAARALSIATDRPVLVALDPAHHGFRVDAGPIQPLPASMSATLRAPAYFMGEHFSGIAFYPNGDSSGGTITLVDGQTQLNIVVGWLTGRVAIDAPH